MASQCFKVSGTQPPEEERKPQLCPAVFTFPSRGGCWLLFKGSIMCSLLYENNWLFTCAVLSRPGRSQELLYKNHCCLIIDLVSHPFPDFTARPHPNSLKQYFQSLKRLCYRDTSRSFCENPSMIKSHTLNLLAGMERG